MYMYTYQWRYFSVTLSNKPPDGPTTRINGMRSKRRMTDHGHCLIHDAIGLAVAPNGRGDENRAIGGVSEGRLALGKELSQIEICSERHCIDIEGPPRRRWLIIFVTTVINVWNMTNAGIRDKIDPTLARMLGYFQGGCSHQNMKALLKSARHTMRKDFGRTSRHTETLNPCLLPVMCPNCQYPGRSSWRVET